MSSFSTNSTDSVTTIPVVPEEKPVAQQEKLWKRIRKIQLKKHLIRALISGAGFLFVFTVFISLINNDQDGYSALSPIFSGDENSIKKWTEGSLAPEPKLRLISFTPIFDGDTFPTDEHYLESFRSSCPRGKVTLGEWSKWVSREVLHSKVFAFSSSGEEALLFVSEGCGENSRKENIILKSIEHLSFPDLPSLTTILADQSLIQSKSVEDNHEEYRLVELLNKFLKTMKLEIIPLEKTEVSPNDRDPEKIIIAERDGSETKYYKEGVLTVFFSNSAEDKEESKEEKRTKIKELKFKVVIDWYEPAVTIPFAKISDDLADTGDKEAGYSDVYDTSETPQNSNTAQSTQRNNGSSFTSNVVVIEEFLKAWREPALETPPDKFTISPNSTKFGFIKQNPTLSNGEEVSLSEFRNIVSLPGHGLNETSKFEYYFQILPAEIINDFSVYSRLQYGIEKSDGTQLECEEKEDLFKDKNGDKTCRPYVRMSFKLDHENAISDILITRLGKTEIESKYADYISRKKKSK